MSDNRDVPPGRMMMSLADGNAEEARRLRAESERREKEWLRGLRLSSGSARRPRRRRRRERLAGTAEEQIRRAICRPLTVAEVKVILRAMFAEDAPAVIEHVLRKRGLIR
jgi:hypothetical protein